MRSAICESPEQLPADAPQESSALPRTRATLPPDTAKFVVPEASGVGSGEPMAAADASWTRWYLPGGTLPDSAVDCQVEPPADAYWIVQLEMSTLVEPRLKS